MPKSISIDKIEDLRFTYFDDGTVRKDKILPARIVEINWEIGKGCATNGKEYWHATVEINEPKQKGFALLWDDLLYAAENFELEENSFSIGSEIKLAIVCNTEDVGNAVIETSNFHIQYKDLYDNGFTGIENFGEVSTVDSEENMEMHEMEEEVQLNLSENPSGVNLVGYEGSSSSDPFIPENIPADINPDTQENEYGCGKTILIFVISFIIIGAVLSPVSFLGFLLYPIWVGGALLLTKFIYNIVGEPTNRKNDNS